MLITSVKPLFVDGRQVFEEVGLNSVEKPPISLSLRLIQPELFNQFTLHQEITISVLSGDA
jgi:hypothetical protein